MTEFDFDMEVMGAAKEKAFSDFFSGDGEKNPFLEGSVQYIWYAEEWERLEYEAAAVAAHSDSMLGVST